MILTKDVLGYVVTTEDSVEEFLRDMTDVDSRGVRLPAQAYNLAWRRAQEVDGVITALGPDSIWDFKAKQYTPELEAA